MDSLEARKAASWLDMVVGCVGEGKFGSHQPTAGGYDI